MTTLEKKEEKEEEEEGIKGISGEGVHCYTILFMFDVGVHLGDSGLVA